MRESEIVQLKRRIAAEYEAGKRGLEGLAQGTSQHAFITQRVENMSRCYTQIVALVGQEQASQILTEVGL